MDVEGSEEEGVRVSGRIVRDNRGRDVNEGKVIVRDEYNRDGNNGYGEDRDGDNRDGIDRDVYDRDGKDGNINSNDGGNNGDGASGAVLLSEIYGAGISGLYRGADGRVFHLARSGPDT